MLTETELDLITIELETISLKSNIFIQDTALGVRIVYYLLDIPLLEKGIVKPLHFFIDDFQTHFNLYDEQVLFKRALENTVKIFQIRGIPLSEYFKEMEKETFDNIHKALIKGLAEKMSLLDHSHQPYCITGTTGIRSSVGALSENVLQRMCHHYNFSSIIIGLCNNDFALAFQDIPENVSMLKQLMYLFQSFLIGSDNIRQKVILKFDTDSNTLKTLEIIM